MKKDYYEILGATKDESIAEIKKKYRSLALKYHPDRVPEAEKKVAEERFKEISEAYGVLSDPKKKELYDRHGHAGIDQSYTSEDIFRGADFNSIFGEAGLGDIFNQFFGGSGGFEFAGGGRSHRAQRGRDIQYETEITLEEAYKGVTKKIKVPRNEHCKTCNGSGAKPGTKMKQCRQCAGRGQVVISSGFFRMQQTCPECQGRGEIITEYCPDCQGKGIVRAVRSIDVTIPPGVDNSSRLRIRNEGEVGSGGTGDLYIYIHVLPHDVFEREGNNLYVQLPVNFVKAALGGEVSVATLNGNVAMKIPAGTESGKTFRLKDKGMPDVHHKGSHGDQYVKVMITVPKRLSTEQKELLEKFAALSGESVEKDESITEKIKKVFK